MLELETKKAMKDTQDVRIGEVEGQNSSLQLVYTLSD